MPLIDSAAGRRAAWHELLGRGTEARVLLGPGPWVDAAARPALLGDATLAHPAAGVVEVRMRLEAHHPLLRDHYLDGRAVLPLTVALELMAELAAAAQPQYEVVAVRDLRVLAGISVDADGREVLMRAERMAPVAEVHCWLVRIYDAQATQRALYEATVELAPHPVPPPPPPALATLHGPFPLDAQEAYARWLFHGPSYQVIRAFGALADSGLDAEIARAGPSDPAVADFLSDPCLLDAAGQLALLWSRAVHGDCQLPNYLRRYHRYGALANLPHEVRLRITGPSNGQAYRADVWFIRDGQVRGWIEGLEGAGSPELTRLIENGPHP